MRWAPFKGGPDWITERASAESRLDEWKASVVSQYEEWKTKERKKSHSTYTIDMYMTRCGIRKTT